MRRIETHAEIESRKKRRTRIFTFLILGILVLSSAGYAFFSNPDSGDSSASGKNGNVVESGGRWYMKFGEQTQSFTSSPEAVKNASVIMSSSLSSFAGKILYISSDNQGIYSEIAYNLNPYVERIQAACYQNCTEDLPEKDCTENLIVFRQGNENKVYQSQNCVFIEGDMRAVDAFLYKIFGVN